MDDTVAIARDDAVGMLFDHYEVEKTLGKGAMGVVYLARDLRIGRKVALKAMPRTRSFDSADAEQEFLNRFRREAELCGSLAHPNIITLYEVGWEGRRISFLAMEYVDGESLLSLLIRERTLPLAPSLKIVDDVLQGLTYAHERHVVHRDIKPANILITRQGQAKIADFGVARYARTAARSRTLTNGGQLIGTPYYMAPELIAGRSAEPSSDLFSVGVVLFELLSGKRPFDGTDLLDILYNIVNAPTPDLIRLRPDLPPWVGAFVRRLLAKAPGDRFPSAEAAIRELRRNLGQGPETNPLLVLQGQIASSLAPEETPTTPIEAPIFPPEPRTPRMVPTSVGLAVIVTAAALLVGAAGLITRQLAVDGGTAVGAPSPEHVVEREAMLREAQLLLESGLYEKSAARYREYLGKYPWSDAAREGELAALAAIEKKRQEELAAARERAREELVTRGRPKRRPPAQLAGSAITAPEISAATAEVAPESEQKLPWWRRIFRRPESAAAAAPAATPAETTTE